MGKNKIVVAYLLSWFIIPIIYTQSNNYKLVDSLTTVSITGTSTIHQWTVTTKEYKDITSSLNIDLMGGDSLENFSFNVVAASLDGGRGPAMNKKIKTALKVSQYPLISYHQIAATEIEKGEKAGHYNLNPFGKLTIAGVEKSIFVEVKGKLEQNRLILEGSKALKFSDFDIEPPSAMFGQIVCGDDITVHFKFEYELE